MLWKPILILLLNLIAFDLQTPQLKIPGERRSDSLPSELTETETHTILKERSPKPHIEATLKVSDTRLDSALRLAEQRQYKSASQDVDIYADLIVYADAYTNKLPGSKINDRNFCLKKIEQTIFKQSRTADALLRELPVDYREPAQVKIDQVKKVRLRALNELLGGGQVIKSTD
jgi:hypothetical protein